MGYDSAGTLEFVYGDGEFYFIEMNTRIQVEHTITEAVTGLDLVREQIKIAHGEPLAFRQDEIRFTGHAIECRVNAEHPETFMPSPGTVRGYHPAGGAGVRMDSALYSGYTVPIHYDSLVAKLVVWGARPRPTPLPAPPAPWTRPWWKGLKRPCPCFAPSCGMKSFARGNTTRAGWSAVAPQAAGAFPR